MLSPFDGPKTCNFNEIKGDNFYLQAVASTPQKGDKTIPKDAKSGKCLFVYQPLERLS